ncbi:MAG: spore coat U domain-containing protein [Candidatus Eremiobacteraeota bacterium]|nr:spore coat U domain-containing protein [Candidatus Eremiobacteraeota bacterium]
MSAWKKIAIALACFGAFSYAPVLAASSSANLTVSATVVTTCSISTAAVAFGNYLAANKQANGSVTVTCPNGTPYSVDLGQGLNFSPGRRMSFSGSFLNYNLYSDAADTIVWGSTSGGAAVAGTGNGLAQILTVFGLVPGLQNVPAGAYSDTVVATVTF